MGMATLLTAAASIPSGVAFPPKSWGCMPQYTKHILASVIPKHR
jgi:hypothetical protein